MIKAIFFDWFNTLALYSPPREELQSRALREFGINASPEQILPALLTADQYIFEESATFPLRKRSPQEQAEIYTRYQQILFTEAGIDIPDDPAFFPSFMRKAQELYKDIRFILFDDVLPTIKTLKEQGLTLGLLTNLDSDMKPVCDGLGLTPYIDFIVTSGEAGADKPQPEIFMVALERAGVEAAEAVHVGDQYKLDVVGAMGVGIKPILIDRNNLSPEITDCPRIQSLPELPDYL
ncbi:HAD family hydrolase [Chloroflexota bacterium]